MCPARTDRRSTSRIEKWSRARSSASNVVAERVGLPADQSTSSLRMLPIPAIRR